MDNNNKHIDNLLREKFETYSPVPPSHIWEGIEKGIITKPATYFFNSKRNIAILAILLLALTTSIILFSPTSTEVTHKSLQNNAEKDAVAISSSDENISNSETIIGNSDKTINNSDNAIPEAAEPLITENQVLEAVISIPDKSDVELPITYTGGTTLSTAESSNIKAKLSIVKLKQSAFIQPNISVVNYYLEPQNYTTSIPQGSIMEPQSITNNSHWKMGYFITPELSISDFDSVRILNSYAISYEPSYFINRNWFVRFGVGFSFVRDRGFARISYLTNEYMGSYNDVFDITFDTVSGIITPIYHTKTVEVWDSVRHVSVSEVTNKYIYVQIPALVGYYHKKPGSEFGWYLMGGPAFNIKIGSWIDKPEPAEKDADIIDLQNNLPIRSNNYFQFWFGAGIEYEINKKLSIAVEPSYRYYFKSIYGSPFNATSSSGVSLRIGLVYSVK